jgi:hypothetical protein
MEVERAGTEGGKKWGEGMRVRRGRVGREWCKRDDGVGGV